MINVLYVEHNTDGTIGGSYFSLLYLLQGLDRSKYRPYLIFYNEHTLLDRFKKAGCKISILKIPKGIKAKDSVFSVLLLPLKKLANFWIHAYVILRFIRFLKKTKIRLVHLNNGVSTGRDWLLASKISGVKCITHQRGFGKKGLLSHLISRYYDGVICVSEAVKGSLISEFPNLQGRVVAIYNGISPGAIDSELKKKPERISEEFIVGDRQPLLGVIGNIHRWKGQEVVIRAIELLRYEFKGYSDLKCLIVGSYSEENLWYYQRLQTLIENGNLHGNIAFTGYRKDRLAIMNALDIMIHASIEPEPFSRVVLEGMYLGKPIISTAIGGTVEQIESGISGILIPPNRPDLLAIEIDKLYRHPDLRSEMGASAREQAQKFHIAKHVADVESFYEQLLKSDN